MRHVNNLGPSKLELAPKIKKEQIRYFNYNKKKDRTFNRFLAVRK